jgi:hypothetical protein
MVERQRHAKATRQLLLRQDEGDVGFDARGAVVDGRCALRHEIAKLLAAEAVQTLEALTEVEVLHDHHLPFRKPGSRCDEQHVDGAGWGLKRALKRLR